MTHLSGVDVADSDGEESRLHLSPNALASPRLDGAWWPRSAQLTAELPGLFEALSDRLGDVAFVGYHQCAWKQAPPQMQIGGENVLLQGFTSDAPATVILIGRNGRRVTLRIISPGEGEVIARQQLDAASEDHGDSSAVVTTGHTQSVHAGTPSTTPTSLSQGWAPASDASSPIVVGVNGSSEALAAAHWASALAERLKAPLHILFATPVWGLALPDLSAATRTTGIDSADATLRTTAESVRGEHPGLAVTTASTTSPADEALAAASRTARLVVLGCDDVTRTGALLIGSTTLTTIAQAHCPIVAWRGSSVAPTHQPIVVDFDGSADDGGALGLAFELAARLDAPLQAVYCWPHHPLSRMDTGPATIEWDESTQAQWRHLNHVIEQHRYLRPQVDATLICEANKPSYALMLYSEYAQLVVLGGRRSRSLNRGLLGSTALNLLHHCEVPLVLCPSVAENSTAHPSDHDVDITG